MRGKIKFGIGAAIGLVIVAILGYAAYTGQLKIPSFTGQGITTINNNQPATNGCAINPSIVYALTDALTPGTALTGGTNYYRLNGVYAGSTAPTTPGTVDVLLTNTSYIAKIHTGFPLNCGSNLFTDSLYLLTNATQTIFANYNPAVILTNTAAGGAYNETVAAAGVGYNWRFHQQGVPLKSTGTEMIVIELSALANVTGISISGATPITVPNGYTRQLTNGYVAAFILPAVTGNVATDNNIAITAATSKIVTGAVYTTTYSIQPFVDTDGTFNSGTSPYDSVNTAKYATYQTYNFLIK